MIITKCDNAQRISEEWRCLCYAVLSWMRWASRGDAMIGFRVKSPNFMQSSFASTI